jgi:hypothetical protein
MDVVGGLYVEECMVPEINQLFGSGGRAAAILSELTNNIALHTYYESDDKKINEFEQNFSIKIHREARASAIKFTYFHPLSTPIISPEIETLPSLEIEGDVVLQFGFMEGDSVVKASRAIFDPQTWRKKAIFSSNGSSAKNLAIVLNELELSSSTSSGDAKAQATELLQLNKANVIVVKMGIKGCLVVENGNSFHIPAFKSSFVNKIGTGDIFSAVFAFYWGEKRWDAYDAALSASKYVACYGESKGLPLNLSILTKLLPIKVNHLGKVLIVGAKGGISNQYLIEESKYVLSQIGVNAIFSFGFENIADEITAILILGDTYRQIDSIKLESYTKKVVVLDSCEKDWSSKKNRPENIEITSDFTTAIYCVAWASVV